MISDKQIVTGPEYWPVGLQEIKDHLRKDADDEDALISDLVDVAVDEVELFTRSKLITQTWDFYFPGFSSEMVIPLAPLQSITSVKYIDDAGAEQTLDASNYQVHAPRGPKPGALMVAYGYTWPTTRNEIYNTVTIRGVVGYGDGSAEVPAMLRAAIKLYLDELYKNRGVSTRMPVNELPYLTNMLSRYRSSWSFGA